MRNNVENTALENMSPKQKGKRIEQYIIDEFLKAARELDPDARQSTDEEDRTKGADAYVFNVYTENEDLLYDIPFDFTANKKKDNAAWADGKPDRTVSDSTFPDVPVKFGIRTGNNYRGRFNEFETPTLVILIDTKGFSRRMDETFHTEVMPKHWKNIIKDGLKFYSKKMEERSMSITSVPAPPSPLISETETVISEEISCKTDKSPPKTADPTDESARKNQSGRFGISSEERAKFREQEMSELSRALKKHEESQAVKLAETREKSKATDFTEYLQTDYFRQDSVIPHAANPIVSESIVKLQSVEKTEKTSVAPLSFAATEESIAPMQTLPKQSAAPESKNLTKRFADTSEKTGQQKYDEAMRRASESKSETDREKE